ncbi:MAG TPA: glycoside hydrolase family 16 protein [Polyangiaceae bacterium]|nr:glycoside hydrolase family 16 protein [Polyangiaceae bacterium]
MKSKTGWLGWGALALASGLGACDDAGVTDGLGGSASGGTASGVGGLPAAGGTASGGAGTGGAAATGGAATGGTTSVPPREDGFALVWSDEFDGPSIDSSKWQHEVNCWGGGNNEQQCYVTAAKNSYIESGMLHVKAIADSPTGAIGGPGNDATQVTRPYSSARLRTAGKADFKYGRFEARIKLPQGQGMWPAFWMLPTAYAYGGWARSGEIDIMEAVNTSPSNNLVYGTLHYGAEWPANVHTGDSYDPSNYVAENFHVYAAEWEQGEIRWFVDDVHFETQDDWYSTGNAFPAPFDQDFHILLNLAVGGAWPGPPNDSTTFPQEMVVDYVRVYQCEAAPDTGIGCGTTDPSVTPL